MAGVAKDNPKNPYEPSVWRRWMRLLGFRDRVFDSVETGTVPETGGVGANYFLEATGDWSEIEWTTIQGTATDNTNLAGFLAAKADVAAGAFDTAAPTSAVAATSGNELVRYTEHAADIAGRQPLDSDLTAIAALATTTWGRALLVLADGMALANAAGVVKVVEQHTEGSALGASSTTEFELFTVTVPADALGRSGCAVIDFDVEIACNAGSTSWRWKVNGANAWANTGSFPPADGNTRYITGQARWAANGTTSSQRGSWWSFLSDETGATGSGALHFGDARGNGAWSDTTDDTTSPATLALYGRFTSSDAANYMKLRAASLKVEPEV